MVLLAIPLVDPRVSGCVLAVESHTSIKTLIIHSCEFYYAFELILVISPPLHAHPVLPQSEWGLRAFIRYDTCVSFWRSLTWDSNGKLLWFYGEKPPAQLMVAAVCWTDQSYGTFAVGRLVIEGHLLIGEDVIVVWKHSLGRG